MDPFVQQTIRSIQRELIEAYNLGLTEGNRGKKY